MKYPYSSYNTPLPGYGTSMVDRINLYLHFRRYYKILAERWLLVVICTVLGLGVGVWQALAKPDIFQSRSVLVVPPKVQMNANATIRIDEDSRAADMQIQVMKSSVVINRVMQRLQESGGPTNRVIHPDFDAQAGRGGTYVMTARGTNFDHCQKFVAAWAQEFIDYKKQTFLNLKSSAEATLNRDILRTQSQLESAQDELDQFKRRHNIVVPGDVVARAQQELEQAKTQFAAYTSQRRLYEAMTAEEMASGTVERLKRGNRPPNSKERNADEEDDDKAFRDNSNYAGLKLELRRLQGQYAEKEKTLRTNHPAMKELAVAITAQEQAIDESLRMAEDLRKAQVKSLRLQEDAYPALIKVLEDEVNEKNALANDFDVLRKKELMVKDTLEAQQRLLASTARISVEDDQFNVIESGSGDPQPVAPVRSAIIATAAALGFLIGLGLLLLLHKLDDRLDDPQRIEEALGQPILGQLPEVDKKHFKEGYLLLNRMKSHTMFAESLRGIRSALLLSPEGTSKRLLAVTSAVPGDGKTTYTANFSITLANAGHKTLLIDADLRRGNVHGYFEQPLEGGLAEVLEGKMTLTETIRETPIKNLWLMRAGARPGNPSELLIGGATKDLIMELRRQFDYVVFDCPPLTAIDDTFSIAAYLDGLFFVVRAGKTSMRFAKMSINTIEQRGAPIIGLIVNGVPIDNPYYYYTTYYYASYYHRPLSPDEGQYGQGTAPAALPAPTEDKPRA